MAPRGYGLRLLSPYFYVEIEDRGIVAESFLAEFFHQLDRNKRDVILTGMLFNTFFHHGAQEVGNPVESSF